MAITREQAAPHMASLYAAASFLRSTESEIDDLLDEVLNSVPAPGDEWPLEQHAQKELLLAALVSRARSDHAASAVTRTQVEQFVAQAVPEAFLHLSQRDQLILLFTYRDDLDAMTVGRIFGLDTLSAGDAIQSAHSNLYHEIQSTLEARGRRDIVAKTLGDRWIIDETRKYVRSVRHPKPGQSNAGSAKPPKRVKVEDPLPRRRRNYRPAIAYLAAIVAIALLGYMINTASQTPEETDLISLAASAAQKKSGAVFTSDADSISAFVERNLDRSLALPAVRGFQPTAVKVARLKDGVEMPMVIFDGGPVMLATTYADLTSFGDAAQLDDGMLMQLASEDSVVTIRNRRSNVYTWRHRDEIVFLISRDELDTQGLFTYDAVETGN